MGEDSLIPLLVNWSPKFWAGFCNNLLICVSSMGIGTVMGLGIGWLRKNQIGIMANTGAGITGLMRNVPSFVLLYYIAFILPPVIQIGQCQISVNPLHKAVIALIFPVIGFTSDSVESFRRAGNQKDINPYIVFWSGWSRYFVIVLMASSTASVIGVSELVSMANLAILAVKNPNYTLFIYLFTAAWFLAAGLIITGVSHIIGKLFIWGGG